MNTDAIDISQAVLTPAANDRPITTSIKSISIRPGGLNIEFDKKDGPDRWPDVPWGNPGDSLQYTVWIGAKVDDVWHIAAGLNIWHDLNNYGGPVSVPSQYPINIWYLDRVLASHTPSVGEPLAFFVTAGGDRGTNAHLVLERSNIVLAPMPNSNGADYTFDIQEPNPEPQPVPVPVPVPVPNPIPEPQPVPVSIPDISSRLDKIDSTLAELKTQNDINTEKIISKFDFTVKTLQGVIALFFGVK